MHLSLYGWNAVWFGPFWIIEPLITGISTNGGVTILTKLKIIEVIFREPVFFFIVSIYKCAVVGAMYPKLIWDVFLNGH